MYFHYIAFIFPLEKDMALHFIWMNFNLPYQRILCAKFSWNWPNRFGEDFYKLSICFHYVYYLSLKSAWPFKSPYPNKFSWNWTSGSCVSNKMHLWNTNPPYNGKFQRWPRSQGQIPWYQYKDLVTRNAHVQYESSNISNFDINIYNYIFF